MIQVKQLELESSPLLGSVLKLIIVFGIKSTIQ